MALTPEDVLKKSFGATQFRRGYDEREVDDFLDEVVNELRDLIAERDDYKRKYEESVKRGGGAVVTKVDDERVAAQAKQIETLKRELAEAKAKPAAVDAKAPAADTGALTAAQGEARKAQEELTAVRAELERKEAELGSIRQELAQVQEGAKSTAGADDATKAAGVLAMAQQLHDQLVAKGEAEKARLVGEGTTQRENLLGEAQQRHDALLAEAQQRHKALIGEATTQHETLVSQAQRKRDEILAGLEEQRVGLERDIAALRAFETKYKQQLIGFLEGKLHEAKNTASHEPKD